MRIFQPKPCRHCGQDFQPWGATSHYWSLKCRLLSETIFHPKGCWIWTGYVSDQSAAKCYGRVVWQGNAWKTHRAAYETWNGTIPKNMHVCHTCDRPQCIRPDHLFLGTHTDNMADKATKGRQARIVGEDNGNKKLTEKDISIIRVWHKSGKSQTALANQFGVHQTTISCIVRRSTWTHLP